jgi:hypothetical protein
MLTDVLYRSGYQRLDVAEWKKITRYLMVRPEVGEKAFLPLSYWRGERQGVALWGTLVRTDNRQHHAHTVYTHHLRQLLSLPASVRSLSDLGCGSVTRTSSPSWVVSRREHGRFGLNFQFATEDLPEPYQPSHRTKQAMRAAVAARRGLSSDKRLALARSPRPPLERVPALAAVAPSK